MKNFRISCLLLFLLGFTIVSNAQKNKPNVILIITDDQGYGDVGAHGNSNINTPNIDQLHAESTRLTNFHVSPTCAPTRAALLTGHYSNKTGVWHTIGGRSLLLENEKTMADIFSENKYKTGAFGKWHLGDNYPYRPMDRGFDESVVHGAGGIWQTPDYWDNDYFDDTYRHNGKLKKYKGYCTDVWFNESMKFIEENKDAPFFCYIATNAPHGPLWVEDSYVSSYENNEDIVKPAFYGMIENVDENIGRLMRKLETLKLDQNTIVIFMTDNGTASGVWTKKETEFVFRGYGAGMRGRKNSAYEGGHRVPFFIRWPEGKIKPNTDINTLTAHIDVLPTLKQLCNLKDSNNTTFDGKNLTPLLYNNESWKSRTLVVDSQRSEHLKKWKKSAVMTEQWRLINGKELYDIQKDFGQKNDVAEAHPEVVKELSKAYDIWWKNVSVNADVVAPIIVGNPAANPTTLTCHDWHSNDKNPFQQDFIRKGIDSNGWWHIKAETKGSYEITLRRWPKHLNHAIKDGLEIRPALQGTTVSQSPLGKPLPITFARLDIGKKTYSDSVSETDTGITFKVKLNKGTQKIKTYFTNPEEFIELGAYFVEIKKI